jgi:hypothetical protein
MNDAGCDGDQSKIAHAGGEANAVALRIFLISPRLRAESNAVSSPIVGFRAGMRSWSHD